MVQPPAIASIHKTPFQTGMPRGTAGRVSGCFGVLWWETGVVVMMPPLLWILLSPEDAR